MLANFYQSRVVLTVVSASESFIVLDSMDTSKLSGFVHRHSAARWNYRK